MCQLVRIVFTECSQRWEINGNIGLINLIEIPTAFIIAGLAKVRAFKRSISLMLPKGKEPGSSDNWETQESTYGVWSGLCLR